MIIEIVKEAWSKGLLKLEIIEWLLDSSELAPKNIKSITKLELLELSAY